MSFRYGKVIHDAWEMTTDLPKLKWFAFIPSFAAVMVFVWEVAWQVYMFTAGRESVESGAIELAREAFGFLMEHHLIGWAIFSFVFIAFFAFVIPPWLFSTLVLSVRQKRRDPEQPISIRQKMYEGAHYFFQIFEFNALASIFQFTSILFFTLTMYRYYGGSFFEVLLPFIILHSLLAFFFNLFLVFTPYYMVCGNTSFGCSVRRSMGLVFVNIGTTVALMLLTFLINIRVIVNVIVVLGVPLFISVAASYFASSALLGFALTAAVGLGVVLLWLAAYLTAILEVFQTAVWEQSFEIMKEEQKALQDPDIDENLEAV